MKETDILSAILRENEREKTTLHNLSVGAVCLSSEDGNLKSANWYSNTFNFTRRNIQTKFSTNTPVCLFIHTQIFGKRDRFLKLPRQPYNKMTYLRHFYNRLLLVSQTSRSYSKHLILR